MRRYRGVDFVSCDQALSNCCSERIFGKHLALCPLCSAVYDFGGGDVPPGLRPCTGCGKPTGGRARMSPIGLHANFPMLPTCEHCLGPFVVERKLNPAPGEDPLAERGKIIP